ncbi:cell wall / vacuolar inhibitor of fructosidase 1-like [Rosa rugosa]|uniref:cell wall / vacuolar inhibitor of fructosidase 1-like n=1 Tax=Rosa rugosa TaxID=74645 RepID=UPI002B40533B|nr:cell wall / vacuolar inhibitor of fructosidase 1-like [Rosa rugosa]
MKNLMCLAAVLIFFIQTAILPTEANIIAQTCQKTPNPPVCLSSLKSDPRSAQADIYGLATIMVDVVKAKSTTTLNQINQLLKQSPRDKGLIDCADSYNAVLKGDVPEAYEAINVRRRMFALDGMNDAVNEANGCESNFAGSSSHPLAKFNKDVADVASVAAAVINQFG